MVWAPGVGAGGSYCVLRRLPIEDKRLRDALREHAQLLLPFPTSHSPPPFLFPSAGHHRLRPVPSTVHHCTFDHGDYRKPQIREDGYGYEETRLRWLSSDNTVFSTQDGGNGVRAALPANTRKLQHTVTHGMLPIE
ncbi:hypothetical protein CMUS01_08201 [Colletotrichum musicola]|uniref:Uncharacterized protein n=1 Tax=Colletotrichum musicola TaxID=2175873 RepID=A0A8H6KE67_9PEZI|nr:hypothetical protein CMUS01_08201 [Colletotrichum musicola]